MDKINISIGSLLFFVCMTICILTKHEDAMLWLCFLLAVLLHETGHLIMARLCHVPIKRITVDLFGADIALCGTISYKAECLIAIGGPLANILTAIITNIWTTQAPHEVAGFADTLMSASIILAIFQLLPIERMDGGRILSTLLSCHCSPSVAHIVLKITTGVFLLCLWLISGYTLLMGGEMVSLFVFSLYMLVRTMRA